MPPHGSPGDAKHRPETRAGQRERCREDALLVLARPVIVGAFRKERPTPGGRPEWVAGRRIERS
jgi:hypothetical protein